MKNSLEVFKGLSEQGEERISDLEDRTMETIKAEEQKEKDWKKQTDPDKPVGHHQEDQYMHHRSPRKEREKGAERWFEEKYMKILKLMKGMDISIQEAQGAPSKRK